VIRGNHIQLASHRMVAGSAKLMAGDLEFAYLRKGKGRFGDRTRHSLDTVVRSHEAEHVHDIGAGNSM